MDGRISVHIMCCMYIYGINEWVDGRILVYIMCRMYIYGFNEWVDILIDKLIRSSCWGVQNFIGALEIYFWNQWADILIDKLIRSSCSGVQNFIGALGIYVSNQWADILIDRLIRSSCSYGSMPDVNCWLTIGVKFLNVSAIQWIFIGKKNNEIQTFIILHPSSY